MVLEAAHTSVESSCSVVNENKLNACFEVALNWAEKKYGKKMFEDQLPEYFAAFGKIFPEDPFFSERMNYFLERAVFEKQQDGQSLYKEFLSENSQDDPEFETLNQWTHSLFQITKITDRYFCAFDLLTGNELMFKARPYETFKFLQKKTIFQGFVFRNHESSFLGQGIILHSPKVIKFLAKTCKGMRKEKALNHGEFLQNLAKRHLKSLRMAHVNPLLLYQDV
jgi:hypothetical protein